jgi:hypothetical protein
VSGTWQSGLPAVPGTGSGTDPDLGGLVDDLLEAQGPAQMLAAATRLRVTVLGLRRLLAHPGAAQALAVLLEQQGPSWLSPGQLAVRLADQAVNVITAVDYLTVLLGGLAVGEDELDQLTRQRLDARAIAVRQGTRLLAMLPASRPDMPPTDQEEG